MSAASLQHPCNGQPGYLLMPTTKARSIACSLYWWFWITRLMRAARSRTEIDPRAALPLVQLSVARGDADARETAVRLGLGLRQRGPPAGRPRWASRCPSYCGTSRRRCHRRTRPDR